MPADVLVLYHGNCIDGFTAAWAASRVFGDDAEYIPCHYGGDVPDVTGKEVLILDFSFPRETLLKMKEQAKSLRLLDHHKTAEEDLRGLDFVVFDMARSGAGLAWDELVGGARPALIEYVEDRDLWKFELGDSRAYNAYVSTVEQTFSHWTWLSRLLADSVIERGRSVLLYIDKYVKSMSAHANYFDYEGSKIPIVNAPYINTSELVGFLAQDALFAVGWFQRGDGNYQYSLRSKGLFDVSELAAKYGGGGHRNAAGFVVPYRVFETPREIEHDLRSLSITASQAVKRVSRES
jgi:oligoribonuclease NrnB/cAMP/cGMP phosphodiesterase (DHH superfamily)